MVNLSVIVLHGYSLNYPSLVDECLSVRGIFPRWFWLSIGPLRPIPQRQLDTLLQLCSFLKKETHLKSKSRLGKPSHHCVIPLPSATPRGRVRIGCSSPRRGSVLGPRPPSRSSRDSRLLKNQNVAIHNGAELSLGTFFVAHFLEHCEPLVAVV